MNSIEPIKEVGIQLEKSAKEVHNPKDISALATKVSESLFFLFKGIVIQIANRFR